MNVIYCDGKAEISKWNPEIVSRVVVGLVIEGKASPCTVYNQRSNEIPSGRFDAELLLTHTNPSQLMVGLCYDFVFGTVSVGHVDVESVRQLTDIEVDGFHWRRLRLKEGLPREFISLEVEPRLTSKLSSMNPLEVLRIAKRETQNVDKFLSVVTIVLPFAKVRDIGAWYFEAVSDESVVQLLDRRS